VGQAARSLAGAGWAVASVGSARVSCTAPISVVASPGACIARYPAVTLQHEIQEPPLQWDRSTYANGHSRAGDRRTVSQRKTWRPPGVQPERVRGSPVRASDRVRHVELSGDTEGGGGAVGDHRLDWLVRTNW